MRSYIYLCFGANARADSNGDIKLYKVKSPPDVADMTVEEWDYISKSDSTVISCVTVTGDDGVVYTAGGDSGTNIRCYSPWPNHPQINYMLTQVQGYAHKSFSLEKAWVDLAIEPNNTVAPSSDGDIFVVTAISASLRADCMYRLSSGVWRQSTYTGNVDSQLDSIRSEINDIKSNGSRKRTNTSR
ncbi:hypothetical protein FACS18949_10660 [Clostridia bacterium]|nr:hypothetical protein FACS18949_10660 [Clostridia bacterium]